MLPMVNEKKTHIAKLLKLNIYYNYKVIDGRCRAKKTKSRIKQSENSYVSLCLMHSQIFTSAQFLRHQVRGKTCFQNIRPMSSIKMQKALTKKSPILFPKLNSLLTLLNHF